ncbi:TetR/AcrR family transcriptional regulator [Paenibacillus sp. DMB20]|uniref:TetR/AcrR family transcriptional regulator n=1 Tax=Paenibacillus sp. DMB20 TaxID=1642570 RepID=UPI00062772AF|nr:TetR/AcrR family transcriptional regulator [Paenibacillus sp. DMB20]KKO54729.1 TetR family transcriptional regulator [Paenibacillus sp. DMB20]
MADKTAEKRKQILVTALQLFSTKGAAATSMQEIAEICGMSKGSLYLHFKSKEELEKSIYEYIAFRIRDEVVQVDQETELAPKEQLRKQAEVLLVHFLEVREFLLKQMHDKSGPGKAPFHDKCVQKEMGKALIWFKNKLCSVYGMEIEPYTMEIAMFVQGMLGSYIRFLFVPGLPLNVGILANHLVAMLDDVTDSLLRRRPDPLVPMEAWERLGIFRPEEVHFSRHPLVVIKALKIRLKELPMEADILNDALDSLRLMEKELISMHPRRVILKGMLANLEAIEGLGDLFDELHATIQSVLSLYLAPGERDGNPDKSSFADK